MSFEEYENLDISRQGEAVKYMTLEEYTDLVIKHLETHSGLFKNMTKENMDYLNSNEAKGFILDDYKACKPAGSAAWIIDLCY